MIVFLTLCVAFGANEYPTRIAGASVRSYVLLFAITPAVGTAMVLYPESVLRFGADHVTQRETQGLGWLLQCGAMIAAVIWVATQYP